MTNLCVNVINKYNNQNRYGSIKIIDLDIPNEYKGTLSYGTLCFDLDNSHSYQLTYTKDLGEEKLTLKPFRFFENNSFLQLYV
jgi:hypothetical protein